MPSLLPAELPEIASDMFGAKIGGYFKHKAPPGANALMSRIGSAFQIENEKINVAVSPTEVVFDVGGRHRNEAWLATPVVDLNNKASELVAKAVKHSINSKNSFAFLATHRFLDRSASAYANQLVMTNCSCLIYACIGPNKKSYEVVLVDRAGPRLISNNPGDLAYYRKKLSQLAPDRETYSNVNLDAVYAYEGAKMRRMAIADRRAISMPLVVRDHHIVGGIHERLNVRATGVTEGSGNSTTDTYSLPLKKYSYAASISYALGPDTGISTGYGGGPNAPNGYVWGDPINGLLCSRSGRDSCLECCDNIMLYYAGGAATALVTGAGAGGFTFGVALAVGAGIAALLLLGGLAHSAACRDSCNQLYSVGTGKAVRNETFRLTAAEYNNDGEQIAYHVEDSRTKNLAKWSRSDVMQLVWGGARVVIEDGQRLARVRLVRRRGGGIYLRSVPDKKIINNLKALPRINP
jgi:hypothetical protein